MLADSPLVMGYCLFVIALLGLCMGSFLNCLAWRMTHDESVLKGRSHCTTCGHVLAARDLVPVLSWVMAKGRCRYCGERVSGRYPATELLCAVAYATIFLRYGLSVQTIELVAFASVLLVLSLTDLDDYVIPNATIVACVAIRLAYVVYQGMSGQADLPVVLRDTLLGGFAVAIPVLVLALVMDRVLGTESFGGGDVKLLFVAGMYFGWQQCLFLVMLACVLGIAFGVVSQRARTAKASDEGGSPRLIPFGPSIAAACWATMLVGEQVVGWYLGFFGL
ncbi:MAG: prepilin peptidase [Atopobiaceae bacterium]|nr:prepilin peptidase [Atopobiaceae bacterium]